mmetsp:Transcript_21495/g.66705  ORF Transcript_21495/g.66705 Transcript_21495/m.66705 type:complete len:236 (+) Transcript_21495:3-710(+)
MAANGCQWLPMAAKGGQWRSVRLGLHSAVAVAHLELRPHLVVHLGEGNVRARQLAHLVVERVVEHLLILVACEEEVSVETLVPAMRPCPRLHVQQRLFKVPRLLVAHRLRHAVRAEVDVHAPRLARVLPVRPVDTIDGPWPAQEALLVAMVVNADGEDEKRVDVELLVEELEAVLHRIDGHHDVLHHVLGDDRFADRRCHEELDEGDLGRAEPTEQIAVQRVVAKRDQVVELPED